MKIFIVGLVVGLVLGAYLSDPVANTIKASIVWVWSKIKKLLKIK